MVDKILPIDKGITYQLFNEKVKEPYIIEPDIQNNLPRHILIREVVKEPKINFYRVPRLGAYMAIKLEYNSCLFEEAFDAAVLNYNDVNNTKKELEQE